MKVYSWLLSVGAGDPIPSETIKCAISMLWNRRGEGHTALLLPNQFHLPDTLENYMEEKFQSPSWLNFFSRRPATSR
jgi:hypothetical protein